MRTLFAILFALVGGSCLAADPKPDGESVFALRVLPILKTKCLACHGADAAKLKGGLDLSTRAKMLAGGDGGKPAIVPNKAADSPLYRAVTRTDGTFAAMPPKENDKLGQSEIAAVREWIDAGAPWPDDARIDEIVRAARPAGETVTTSGGLSADWTNRTYKPEDLWAYRPLARPPVPPGAGSPIDRFVDARLRHIALPPAPVADRRTLIRRATFDLTGLPPTPAEIDAFLADPDADDRAFARVIDRLMASPHYGEQMARHWLDLARYADSSGFSNDYDRGNAWRYRDYVVRAFNADMPYDRFVAEQIAGDEIDAADPERLVAVGFLRMGAWELTSMEVPKVARQRFLDDVTDAVGQVFLGQMLQCARCHDHKFDPVPTRDYYRIQAVFATTQIAERPAAFLKTENTGGFDERKYLDARKAALEAESVRIQKSESAARARWEQANPDKKGQKPPRHELIAPSDLGLERFSRKGLERLKWEYERYEPVALSVYTGKTPIVKAITSPLRPRNSNAPGEWEICQILAGGDPFSPTEAVTPGVLSAALPGTIPDRTDGRRKALAQWIIDPRNPLTARVMANRVWQWTIGVPLAGNPNNFGASGRKPSHPELLDWLSAEFVAGRWSVKRLQRQILLSSAYRRSSRHPDPRTVAARDPAGTAYAFHKSRRLSAEELRDAMLAASGEWNPTVGGIPVRPEINADVAFQTRTLMGSIAPAWEPSPKPEQRHRRTIYTLKLRGVRDPFQEVFNAPGADFPCEARESSTVAPQALALLNAETTRGRALALAVRVRREARTEDEPIARMFQLVLGRAPTSSESDACRKHWQAMTARHLVWKPSKPKRPTEIARTVVEENTGETTTFVEKLVAVADFVPDPHPADFPAELRGLMEVAIVLFNTNEFVSID
jgi:mono/diheme cytochrome c family protein